MDRATSAQIALEKRLEQLETELAFMQKIHKEVIHLSADSLLVFIIRSTGSGFNDRLVKDGVRVRGRTTIINKVSKLHQS